MKLVKDILYQVNINAIYGGTDKIVSAVVFDSREVRKDNLFVAQRGLIFDGHEFIGKAIKMGATTIVCEEFPNELKPNITYVQVEDSNSALAIIASNFYDNPSSKLKLIGVTGTNGKTTIVSLLYALFLQCRI